MKKFKFALIAILAMIMLFALPLAACGNGGNDDSGNTNENPNQNPNENPNDKDPDDKDPDDKDPDEGGDTDPIWTGEWKSLDGSLGFSIAADGANVIENGAKTEATISAPSDTSLTLTAGEKTYSLGWYDGGIASKIMILTEGGKTSYFIPAAAPAIGDDFDGTWYDQYAPNTLKIDAKSGTASFNGEDALAVVDCGVVETWENNDGSTVNINHQCLYLIMEDGGDVYFVGWYKDSTSAGEENGREFNCPTVTTPEDCETPLTFRSFIELFVDPDLVGTWRNVKGDINIVIDGDAKTATVNGAAAQLFNNGGTKGSGNLIVYENVVYRLEPDPGYNYYLTRERVVELGMGPRDYFLKSDHNFGKVENTNLNGTEWEDITGTHKLSIGTDGTVTFDNVVYTVFVAELLDNLSYKVIAISENNQKVELSYASGSLTLSDGFTSLNYLKVEEGGGEDETGFLGLTVGAHVNAENRRVEVTKDSLIIKMHSFDFYDDEDITVTMDMLTEVADPLYGSSKHYTFTWKDSEDVEHTAHIALDVSVKGLGESEATSYKFMIAFSDYNEHFFNK